MGNEFIIREQHDLLNSFASVQMNGVLLNAVSNRLLIRAFNNKSGRCTSRTCTLTAVLDRHAKKETWWKTQLIKYTNKPPHQPAAAHSHVYSIIASWLLGFSSAIESSHEAEPEWHRVHLDLNAWLGSHSSEMIFIESVTLRWACSLISSLIAHNIWTDVELAGSGHIQGLWDVSTLDHLSRKALSRATVRLI